MCKNLRTEMPMTTAPQPPPPTRLGRYEIVRELGHGAMGVVYEAFDPVIKRRVAIKTARRDVFTQAGQAEEMMTRFIREAQAAGALNHPNIITIHDTGDHEGISFIVMEFIEGGSLHEQLRLGQRWDPADVAGIGATLAEALAAAHERGIVHRDIKPANIMVPTRGPVKIADFGIAHTSDSTLTRQGDMIGTPYYMSPEQFMGQKVDARSDLFSLAIILYEMLTGERPFRGQAINTVMHECLKAVPTPPQELNFAVPPCLGGVLLKALEKSPLHRYQNGIAFAEALRECVKEHPDPAITKVTPNDATVVGGAAAETLPPAQTKRLEADLEATDVGIPVEPLQEDKKPLDVREKLKSRKYLALGAIAGIAAIIVISLLPHADNAPPTGNEGIDPSAPFHAKVYIHAFGVPTQECYDSLDYSNLSGTDCFVESIEPEAVLCDADNPTDCLKPFSFEDATPAILDGKQWKSVRVVLTHPGYKVKESVTKAAVLPNDSAYMDLVLLDTGIEE
jgi:serine/threonine protein kinase